MTTKELIMSENLNTAADLAKFTRNDLRAALAHADPVGALLLLPLIERAAQLAQEIRTLEAAMREAAKAQP